MALVTGCGGDRSGSPAERAQRSDAGSASGAELPTMTVYRSPTCGCCAKWVEHVREAGFDVVVVDDDRRLHEAKRRHAIGPGHTSCHTAEVGGYFIEGHVPAEDIVRLLSEGPEDVAGLAVPGMPMGSPGMEGPREDDYDVVAIRASGETRVFASH